MQMTPIVVEIRDQNLYGPESNIDCIYEGGNVRSFALPQSMNQILPSPGRNIDRNLPWENIYNNIRDEGNTQNLYSYHPTRDNINTFSGRTGSSQSLTSNDLVFNSNGAGLDQTNWGAQNGLVLALLPLNLLPDLELSLILLIFLNH